MFQLENVHYHNDEFQERIIGSHETHLGNKARNRASEIMTVALK